MVHIFLFGLLILPFCVALLPVCSLSKVDVRPVTPPVQFGQNPHWDDRQQVLYYVDTFGPTVYRFDPLADTLSSVNIEGESVSVAITTQNDNQLIATSGRNVVTFSWDGFSPRGPLTILASVDGDKPNNRLNDGKADASGRLWIGTNSLYINDNPVPKEGALYAFSSNKNYQPETQVQGITLSNGIGWNNDNSLMYYTDSTTKKIFGYKFDLQKGALGKRFTIFDLAHYDIPGMPDGIAVDENDNLWIAVYNSSSIIQVNPSNGELLRRVPIPVREVIGCTFGGPDLSTLYVTTSRLELKPEEMPLSGSVFRVDGLGVRGQRKSNIAQLN